MEAKENNRLALVDPAEEITSKSILPVNTASKLQVNSQAELEQAGEIVRILKDLQDEVNRVFEPIVKQAFQSHKIAKAAQNNHLRPLQEAEAALRVKINTYLRKVELDRLVAEAARQKAEENLKQQPAVKSREVLSSEIGVDLGVVDRKFSASAIAPPRLPEVPAPPKAEGMSSTQEWLWKVADISQIPAEFWILDENAISRQVRATKGETKIPGIEVYSEGRVVIRR